MIIYFVRFFSACSWGVLYPFFGIWILSLELLDSEMVAIVLGIAVIALRIGSLSAVFLVNRIHKRTAIIYSQFVVVASALSLHFLANTGSSSVIMWMVVACLFGLANSITTLALNTFIATQFSSEKRTVAFSFFNVAANTAGGVAPLLSSVLIVRASNWFALGPIVFAVASVILTLFVEQDRSSEGKKNRNEDYCEFDVLDIRGILLFLSVVALTSFAYAQFYGVFPIYAISHLREETIGILFAFSSVLIITFQIYLTKILNKVSSISKIFWSNILLGIGTSLLMLVEQNIILIVGGIILLVVAEMIYGPLYHSLAVSIFKERASLGMAITTSVFGSSEAVAVFVGISLVGRGLGEWSFGLGVLVSMLVVVISGIAIRSGTFWRLPPRNP